MRNLRKLGAGMAIAGLVVWLALRPQSGVDDRLVEREFLAMGTILSVSLYLDEGQHRPAAEQALRDLQAIFDAYAQRWSAWGNGTLGQLNRQLAGGAVIDIPTELQPLFAAAARYSALSGGRFDVRIGKLTELWGFNDETRFRSTPPDPAQIAETTGALAAAPALSEDPVRYGPAADIWLDFGAIAKGDATDLAIIELRRRGYPNAIVNAGGNLRAAGRRGKRAWRVGVRHPRPDTDHRVLSSMEIRGDEAVITSGDYERHFEFQGQRYHHLLDPRSGMPAGGLQAVTVVTSSGALADAASTALFVAGPRSWRQVASDLGITQAFVVLDDGRIQITAALAPRMQFADGVQVEILP